jgi:hypothetical protein
MGWIFKSQIFGWKGLQNRISYSIYNRFGRESKVPSITENFMESEVEKVPWWEFHGTRAVD